MIYDPMLSLSQVLHTRPTDFIIDRLRYYVSDNPMSFTQIIQTDADHRAAACADGVALASVADQCDWAYVYGDTIRLRTSVEQTLSQLEQFLVPQLSSGGTVPFSDLNSSLKPEDLNQSALLQMTSAATVTLRPPRERMARTVEILLGRTEEHWRGVDLRLDVRRLAKHPRAIQAAGEDVAELLQDVLPYGTWLPRLHQLPMGNPFQMAPMCDRPR